MNITDETYTLDSLLLWCESQMGEPPERTDRSPKAEQTRAFRRTTQTRISAIRTVQRVLKPKEQVDIRKIVPKLGWLQQRMHSHSQTKQLSPATIKTTTTNTVGTIRAYLKWIEEDPELRDGSFDCNRLDKGLKAPLAELGAYKLKLQEATRQAEAEARRKAEAREQAETAKQRKKLEEIEANRQSAPAPAPQPLRLIPGTRPEGAAEERSVADILQTIQGGLVELHQKLGPALDDLKEIHALRKRNQELEAAFELLRGLDREPAAPAAQKR